MGLQKELVAYYTPAWDGTGMIFIATGVDC